LVQPAITFNTGERCGGLSVRNEKKREEEKREERREINKQTKTCSNMFSPESDRMYDLCFAGNHSAECFKQRFPLNLRRERKRKRKKREESIASLSLLSAYSSLNNHSLGLCHVSLSHGFFKRADYVERERRRKTVISRSSRSLLRFSLSLSRDRLLSYTISLPLSLSLSPSPPNPPSLSRARALSLAFFLSPSLGL
jgi:hypothetical protein